MNSILQLLLEVFFRLLSKYKINGIRDRLPRANRIPLKVKAPIYSEPTLCATNANPHIAEVSSKSKLARYLLVLI